jgi:hypothetical protein
MNPDACASVSLEQGKTMTAHLISFSQCVAASGLVADEMIVGVAPSQLHDRLYESYLRHRKDAQDSLPDRIVRDIRGCISLGAMKPAADLVIVLRRVLTQRVQRNGAAHVKSASKLRSRAQRRRSAKRRRNFPMNCSQFISVAESAPKAGACRNNVLSLDAFRRLRTASTF